MVDNQHKKISGYRDLSEAEISLMNEVKAFEAKWNGLVDRLRAQPAIDQRKVALAITAGEDAFMRAVRAIAQPEEDRRMSKAEWAQGDTATYDGIMTGRCGQRVTIVGVMTDGEVIRVARRSVRPVDAPQGGDF